MPRVIGKTTCPVCGRLVAVTESGQLLKHGQSYARQDELQPSRRACAGSGEAALWRAAQEVSGD